MARKIFITGVSSGIGFGLARHALEQGDEVYGVSRREPGELVKKPGFHFRAVDLGIEGEIGPSVQELFSGVSKIDLAILNAGILGPIGDLSATALPEMLPVMQINVWANKILLDALFSMGMKIDQVITISSGVASHPNRGWNAYCISKVALNALTALYAAEKPETHFCAFAPGIVDTQMQEQISHLPDEESLSDFERLKAAKGTELMPGPENAAPVLMEAMAKACEYPSGSFLHLRELMEA